MTKSFYLIPALMLLAACGSSGGGNGGLPGLPVDPDLPPNVGNGITAWNQVFSDEVVTAMSDGGMEANVVSTDDVSNFSGATSFGIAAFDAPFTGIRVELDGNNLRIVDAEDVAFGGQEWVHEIPLAGFNANQRGSAVTFEFQLDDVCTLDMCDGIVTYRDIMIDFVEDGVIGQATFDSASSFRALMEVQFGGRSVGLQFAEFGYWTDSGAFYDSNDTLLAGGLDPWGSVFTLGGISAFERTMPTENTTFTGSAFGILREDVGGGAYSQITSMQGSAVLEIAGGSQNLSANFGSFGDLACVDCANASTFSFNGMDFGHRGFETSFYGAGAVATEVVGTLSGGAMNPETNQWNAFLTSFGAVRDSGISGMSFLNNLPIR